MAHLQKEAPTDKTAAKSNAWLDCFLAEAGIRPALSGAGCDV